MKSVSDGLRQIASIPDHVELSPIAEELRRAFRAGQLELELGPYSAALQTEKMLAAATGGCRCLKCGNMFLHETARLIGCPECFVVAAQELAEKLK